MTMLDRMRRHKGWLKWSLALVVLAFVIFYIPDFLQPQPTAGVLPGDVIAEVEGEPVTVRDFQARYYSEVQRFRAQMGASFDPSLLRQFGIEQQILQQMIEEHMAALEAERQGIVVTNEELAEQITSDFRENGQFIGYDRYRQILAAANPPMSVSEFEEGLRRQLLIDRLRTTLTGWIAVPDAELEQEYRRRNEKVKLQLVALTPETFRDQVMVTDEDVAAYFEAHQAEYRVGEQRRVRYLLLDRDEARARTVVTPAEVQRYYSDNISLYRTPEELRASHILLETKGKDEDEVRTRAEEVLAKVKGGADLAALAKELSEDQGSAAKGGDLGFFGRGQMVAAFETAAFGMQPGETSDLVRSDYGYHIIRVTERRDAVTRPLDEVRAEIQDRLATQKANEQVTTRANQLAGRIRDAERLTSVAAEEGLSLQESDLFTRSDTQIPGLGVVPQGVEAAFSLEPGQVSGPVTSARGPVFLAVTETRDPYIPALDAVTERVRDDLIRSKALELSRDKAGTIASALSQARDFAAAAKAQGVEVHETMLISRGSVLPGGIGVSPEVDSAAFALKAGAVSDPITATDGTVILRVAERDDVTPEEFAAARESFRAQLTNERQSRFFASYMTQARDRMAIVTHPEVIQRLLDTLE